MNESSEACNTSTDSFSTGKSSTSTLRSGLSVSTITSKKLKNAARKKSMFEKRKERKRIKKIEKNKIDKDDFYSKHTEFRTWLWEAKGIKFEVLSAAKAKDHFKKFTKKWNSRKLPKQYYRGIDACWMDGSPATQSLWAMPKQVDVTPGSLKEEALQQRYSREVVERNPLGTFGKSAGRKALQELQHLYLDQSESSHQETFMRDDVTVTGDITGPSSSQSTLSVHKTSSSSLPESRTCHSKQKVPKRSSSLTNMVSTNLTAVFEDEIGNLEVDNAHVTKTALAPTKRTTRSTGKPVMVSSPQKMKKQDSYANKIERASPSVFQALRIGSRKKKTSFSSIKQRPHSLCDSQMHQPFSQSEQLALTKDQSFRKSAVLGMVDGVCTPSKW